MNKGFWSHLKHFGRLLGKNNLFFAPSKTDRRVPSQQGAPTTCNLEVSQQTYVQTLLASLGVVIWQNSALQWGLDRKLGVWPREDEFTASVEGGWGGGRFPTPNPLRHPELSFPSNAFNFLPGAQNYFKIAQPAKICLKNRYLED